MGIGRSDEFGRMTAEYQMREFTSENLRRMIREDLEESIKLGTLSPEQAAHQAMQTILDWKSEK